MFYPKPCILAALAALALAPSARADVVQINFDEPGGPKDYAHLGAEVLTWDPGIYPDGSLGWGSGPYRVLATPLAKSPPNIAMPLDIGAASYRDIGAYFTIPDPIFVRPAPVDFVSFWLIPTGPFDGWKVQFFADGYGKGSDPNSVIGVVDGQPGPTLVSFYRPENDISGFAVLSPEGTDGIDDLSFDAPVVPEPGTLLLALVGGLALLPATAKLIRH